MRKSKELPLYTSNVQWQFHIIILCLFLFYRTAIISKAKVTKRADTSLEVSALILSNKKVYRTAINENVVGHIMLRYPDSSKTVIRFGFIIVDDNLRGKGYGKQMLQLAIQKAQQEFGAKKITLGVFDNNPSAFHCYESVGFKVIGTDSCLIDGEEWTGKEMEMSFIT